MLLTSEQLSQSFGKESKGDKPKETKSDSKPKKVDKPKDKAKPKKEDKPKDDTKSKGDNKESNVNDKTKNNEDIKHDDPSSTSTDNPSTTSIADTSTTPVTMDSESSLTSITNLDNPTPTSDTSTTPPTITHSPTTLTTTIPLTTSDQTVVSKASSCPDGYQISLSGECKISMNNPSSTTISANNSSSSTPHIAKAKLDNPSSVKLGTNTSQSISANTSQSLCNSTNVNCPLPDYTRCPNGYNINHEDGNCYFIIHCDPSKKLCPKPVCNLSKGDCTDSVTCNNGYNININDGLCHYKGPKCNLPKEQCPPLTYDPIPDLTTNNNKKTTETSTTETVIKYYITNPIIQQQITNQSSNALIPLDTIQFCNSINDQACVFANSNMKILFVQTTKDNFGNWVLNGEAQNIGTFAINNVRVVWHLYDALGNIVGVTQGFPIPSNLETGQTTLFNLQIKATDLTGIPKFFRVSFDLLS